MVQKLILGTVQLGLAYGINNLSGKPDTEEAKRILQFSYNAGITTLDTANAYGNAEEIIGDYHKSNSLFQVNTKFHSISGKEFYSNLKATLNRLNIERILTYMYHRFDDMVNLPEIKDDLLKARQEGLIGEIGVSVYSNDEFREAITADHIDVIQLPFNLLDNWNQRGELIMQAKQAGKTIHTRSAFLQGLFFRNPSDDHKVVNALSEELLHLNRIAEKEKVSMASLALNYCLMQPHIDNVLIGVDSLEQLKNNLSILSQPVSLAAIDEINTISVKNQQFLSPTSWN